MTEHSENVDELGHDRETGTAGADRVDEIAAENQPGGQGAGPKGTHGEPVERGTHPGGDTDPSAQGGD
jgi:hypothetical protein